MTLRNRKWRVGEGHVGLAIRENSILFSGDLRQSSAWQTVKQSAKTDRQYYVSAVTVPMYLNGTLDKPDGVFIVTSNRVDHFLQRNQAEVLTAETIATILSLVWS